MAEPAPIGRGAVPRDRPAQAAAHRELKLWLVIGVVALGLAGLFALLLAVSRIPGIESVFPWPVGFFHKGLVIHVVFSFVVWFVVLFAALAGSVTWDLAGGGRPRLAVLGPAAALGSVVSLPLLFVPALLDRGEATLNNYIPTIIDPLYYAGLVLLGTAATLVALRLLANLRRTALIHRPVVTTLSAAAVVYLVALACFGLAWWSLGNAPLSHAYNEDLFWGGGHLLQFFNALLMIAAWGLLAGWLTNGTGPARWPQLLVTLILLGLVLPAPVLYVVLPPFSTDHTQAFTDLKWILGHPLVVVAIAAVAAVPRPIPWRAPAFVALALSILLFAVGGFFGLFVDGADTRTPAHYHAVIAAVMLALMGLFYTVLIAQVGAVPPSERWQRLQLHLFAWGQLLACVGLFIAGGHGAPRKVAGEAQGLEGLMPVIGLAMNGLGGLIAVIGGAIFVVLALLALTRKGDWKTGPVPAQLRL